MKVAAIGLLVGAMSAAHAKVAFDEYSAGNAPRPAQQVHEASCDIEVSFRAAIATVEVRQRIVNPGPGASAVSYEHEIPKHAQVVGFSMRGEGGVETALPVDRVSPSIEGRTPGINGVDPAILVRHPGAGYHVIIQPIAPNHDAVITTRYVVPTEVRAGTLKLVLPGRGASGKLSACRGSIRALPGPGASVRKIRVNSVDTTGGHAAPFVLGAQDVAIQVELAVAGTTPLVWTQSQPLADGWNASVVTVLAPHAIKPLAHARVVLLIDGSRSMELVGRHNVLKIVDRIGAALPKGIEIEAIIFDRTATRVFGDPRPATPDNLDAIEAAIHRRGAINGSDMVSAFALAKQALRGVRGHAMLIMITDGVTAEIDGPGLAGALAEKPGMVDVHMIVVDPATTRSPGGPALRAPVNRYGGAYVEVAVDELDESLAAIDDWLRPSWLELRLGEHAIPTEIRAGGGFTRTILHKGSARFTLTGHGTTTFSVAARIAPDAPVAAFALAGATPADFTRSPDPTETELELVQPTFEHALAAHPFASSTRSLAVLAATGKVAKSRRAVVAGGGRYERVIALPDPVPTLAPPGVSSVTASAIARPTLERLFREQLQPKAYLCYQRALGRDAKLTGTAHFQFRMGRGEVTEVTVTGFGDTQLDGCLLDAAYQLTPPIPDFAINADDQTIVNYPLTFNRRDDQAVVVLGDADSTSPLDIDGIQGGVPAGRRRPIRLDPSTTKTPLGGMRPPKSP